MALLEADRSKAQLKSIGRIHCQLQPERAPRYTHAGFWVKGAIFRV